MAKNIRNLFAILISLSLLSCGFEVIYSDKKSGISYQKELATIKIQKSDGRLSQELRNSLYDIFNPGQLDVEAKYYLVLNIREGIGSTFLTTTGASGRNKVTIFVDYELRDLKTGSLLATGSSNASDNYDVQENRYGTYSAEEYIKSNIVKILAQNLRNLLVNDLIEEGKKSGTKSQNSTSKDN